ncbi:hypothetical protein EVAR_63743_1 [Eumeta japonica]|uniref:Uncharacterized protein n=1 Tax=Eumeta variegata TaxID=151549 RepID=A0A4C1ZSH4_EUMVA|nr:hypothetical protein EVAR_63743_1 [Eumeta japonica]
MPHPQNYVKIDPEVKEKVDENSAIRAFEAVGRRAECGQKSGQLRLGQAHKATDGRLAKPAAADIGVSNGVVGGNSADVVAASAPAYIPD